MSKSDKKLNLFNLLFEPRLPPLKTKVTKKLKRFVMFVSKQMILILHNKQDKQKTKLTYVHVEKYI